MTVTLEQIIAELRRLPPDKLVVVNDFVGYLRHRAGAGALAAESAWLAEAGMDDYLARLEDYEDKVARGEIRWE
jgi:hypothetical protein